MSFSNEFNCLNLDPSKLLFEVFIVYNTLCNYIIIYMYMLTILLPWLRLPVLPPNDVRGGRRDSSHLHGKVAHNNQ